MLARFHCAFISCQMLCMIQLHVVHSSCAFVFLSEYCHTHTKVHTVCAIHMRSSVPTQMLWYIAVKYRH